MRKTAKRKRHSYNFIANWLSCRRIPFHSRSTLRELVEIITEQPDFPAKRLVEAVDALAAEKAENTLSIKKRNAKAAPPRTRLFRDERWMALRRRVIRKYGRYCMKCGELGSPAHVDHIKPRATHPELTYEFSNLQVLCKGCNERKGATEADYRPVAKAA